MSLTLLPHSQQLLAIRAWGARRVSKVAVEVNGLRHIVMPRGRNESKKVRYPHAVANRGA